MQRTTWLTMAVASVLAGHALAEDPGPDTDEERRNAVFATVGSKTISVGDIEDIVSSRSPYARQRLLEPSALQELADAQVQAELYYQGAAKLGYGDSPDVQRFVNQTIVKLFVRKEFEEAVTPNDVPAEEVSRYYDEHPEEFRRPEMRRARHILVGSKNEAEDIRARLIADDGQKFREIAKKESLDTETNVRGGDLLYFTSDGKLVGRDSDDTVNETLVAAAFALTKAGELSKPLDLGDGKWSILELTGIRPERVQTLEQVTSGIQRKLWREERETALDALLAKVRAEVKPEIYPERLNAIVLEQPDKPIEPPNQ